MVPENIDKFTAGKNVLRKLIHFKKKKKKLSYLITSIQIAHTSYAK